MIRVLLIFVLLLISIYLGLQLNHDPGYVLIAINHWSVETTLSVALFALLLLFVLIHAFLVFMKHLMQSPHKYQEWKAKKRAQKAQSTTRRGLIEFSEGYWSSAKNHLIKALPDTDTPLLNYLTAARAAQEMGDSQLRDDFLREAQQSMPDAKIAVELTQAQLQLANKQWEQALATLRHLQDLAPHHPYVLKLLMHLYQEIRDWPQLLNLLPELKKYHVVNSIDFEQLQRNTYLQAMNDLTRVSQEKALAELISKLPKALKCDADLMACYCHFLILNKQYTLAEPILRQCLRKEFSEKLINLYGQFFLDEKQLQFAESLLKKQISSAALFLCLGRLCSADHLWGKAKTYFEKSINMDANPQAYAEMGKLFEQFGEQGEACKAYRQGLALVVNTAE